MEEKQINKVDELVLGSEGIKEIIKAKTLNLVHNQHPLLKTSLATYDFASESNEARSLFAASMIHTMRGFGGVGLSANQVGVPVRMFVMDRIDDTKKERTESLVCYNPVVIRTLSDPVAKREGCLSYPGLALSISRPAAVEVRFENENGELFELELSGIDAKCFQHELDHMNGILFTSKVKQQGILSWELEKQRKIIKKVRKQYGRSQGLRKLKPNHRGVSSLHGRT